MLAPPLAAGAAAWHPIAARPCEDRDEIGHELEPGAEPDDADCAILVADLDGAGAYA